MAATPPKTPTPDRQPLSPGTGTGTEGVPDDQMEIVTAAGDTSSPNNYFTTTSQLRWPSQDADFTLLSHFPGLNHRRPANLPFNRFELELVEPGSLLHSNFTKNFKQVKALDQPFDISQLITLALLAAPERSASVKVIATWLLQSFPAIQTLGGGPAHFKDTVGILYKSVTKYCQHAEKHYYRDITPKGALGARSPDWPAGSELSYFLPRGNEDEIFRSTFSLWTQHWRFGLSQPDPEVFTGQQFSKMPAKIIVKIIGHVLTFPHPLAVEWDASVNKNNGGSPRVSVCLPPSLRSVSTNTTLALPPRDQLLALFLVCRGIGTIAKYTFYTSNTFRVHSSDIMSPPAHVNLYRFLSRIGPAPRQFLRSVDFDIHVTRGVQFVKDIESAVKLLGESYCLQHVTLRIDMSSLSDKAQREISFVPGFRDLVKFRGLKHVTVFGSPPVQLYLDSIFRNPFLFKDAELEAAHAHNERLDAELADRESKNEISDRDAMDARSDAHHRWVLFSQRLSRLDYQKREREVEDAAYFGPAYIDHARRNFQAPPMSSVFKLGGVVGAFFCSRPEPADITSVGYLGEDGLIRHGEDGTKNHVWDGEQVTKWRDRLVVLGHVEGIKKLMGSREQLHPRPQWQPSLQMTDSVVGGPSEGAMPNPDTRMLSWTDGREMDGVQFMSRGELLATGILPPEDANAPPPGPEHQLLLAPGLNHFTQL
ncbi:hypothetical protein BCR34DRAFT_99393 [Clohesyomyces aquaticus]|uniref:Uncharacterized protein n=1 Tax=Clohesyomyces aquaticus TaxID=1231657 RepID=A0A1Y1YT96_9PLEO|nr:hypothetical protein BCR34DRAFT_99393 [Clohesyomyces aquaticus]